MLLFSIVKEHTDRLDPMGLLAMGAPKNEYDHESRMIAERITPSSSAEAIAQIMADVFSRAFSRRESPAAYQTGAQKIFDDLHP